MIIFVRLRRIVIKVKFSNFFKVKIYSFQLTKRQLKKSNFFFTVLNIFLFYSNETYHHWLKRSCLKEVQILEIFM